MWSTFRGESVRPELTWRTKKNHFSRVNGDHPPGVPAECDPGHIVRTWLSCVPGFSVAPVYSMHGWTAARKRGRAVGPHMFTVKHKLALTRRVLSGRTSRSHRLVMNPMSCQICGTFTPSRQPPMPSACLRVLWSLPRTGGYRMWFGGITRPTLLCRPAVFRRECTNCAQRNPASPRGECWQIWALAIHM